MSTQEWDAMELLKRAICSRFRNAPYVIMTNGTPEPSALVVCSGSKGLFFAGVSVTSRPPKRLMSKDWWEYCQYQWVVAPGGEIAPEEVYPGWGLIEVSLRATVVFQATKLKPKRLDYALVAFLARRTSRFREYWSNRESQLERRVDELSSESRRMSALRTDASNAYEALRGDTATARRELSRCLELLGVYERVTGIGNAEIEGLDRDDVAEAYRVARGLVGEQGLLSEITQLGEMARALSTNLAASKKDPTP